MIKKFLSSVLVVAVFVMTTGIMNPLLANAASITTASDTLSRLKASTASNHTITFVTPTGVAAGQTITLTTSGFTGTSGILFSDVDFGVSATGACTSFTEKTLAAVPATTTWGVASSGSVITITSGTDTVAATKCVRVMIGTNAVYQTTGVNQLTNPTVGTATVTIGGTFTDTGIISISIIDDDQVTITATVNQTMTFDLDAAADFHNGESSGPYSVPLGVLSSATVTHSDDTAIRMIVAEGDTNSSGGMNVSIRSANGANGLVSTSTPADKIASATASMVAGTSNYGLCAASAGLTGFTRSGTYSTTCALNSGTNAVVGLTTTATDILTSTAPLSGGHAELVVNAAIAGAQAAHTDYTDTLTFIGTASY